MFTKFAKFANFTKFTKFTKSFRFTKLTKFTKFIKSLKFTKFTKVTQLTCLPRKFTIEELTTQWLVVFSAQVGLIFHRLSWQVTFAWSATSCGALWPMRFLALWWCLGMCRNAFLAVKIITNMDGFDAKSVVFHVFWDPKLREFWKIPRVMEEIFPGDEVGPQILVASTHLPVTSADSVIFHWTASENGVYPQNVNMFLQNLPGYFSPTWTNWNNFLVSICEHFFTNGYQRILDFAWILVADDRQPGAACHLGLVVPIGPSSLRKFNSADVLEPFSIWSFGKALSDQSSCRCGTSAT